MEGEAVGSDDGGAVLPRGRLCGRGGVECMSERLGPGCMWSQLPACRR